MLKLKRKIRKIKFRKKLRKLLEPKNVIIFIYNDKNEHIEIFISESNSIDIFAYDEFGNIISGEFLHCLLPKEIISKAINNVTESLGFNNIELKEFDKYDFVQFCRKNKIKFKLT